MRILLSIVILLGFGLQASRAEPYRFQPGDVISFSVWDDPKMDRQLLVAPDGKVSIPLVGQVRAAKRTANELEVLLRGRLRKNYKTEPIVSISLTRLKPKEPELPEAAEEEELPQFFVTGEVPKPGGYDIRQPTTVLQAISLAGGLATSAARRRIKILRKAKTREIVIPFDYVAVTQGRNSLGNIYLRKGDVIVVDPAEFYVTGEVQKPGAFSLRKPTTVLQAISLAGGLDIFAARRRIRVVRKERGEEIVIRFNYVRATRGRSSWRNVYLRDGDVVVVPERGLLRGLF